MSDVLRTPEVPELLAGGFPVVAPDLVGFGRSDKPADDAAHSDAGHVEWLRSALVDGLGLGRVAPLCQDALAAGPGTYAVGLLLFAGLRPTPSGGAA